MGFNIPFELLLILGAIVRIGAIVYAHYHDKKFPQMKYTDIDYMIITDGAAEMLRGGTPFDRTTFRYTPLLSALMIPNVLLFADFGKILFAMCDIGAAYYCHATLLRFSKLQTAKVAVSLFILFNPIVVNVSTRGNSDMVVTLLSLVTLAKFFERKYVVCSLWLGFAIHFKIYPIIYAAPLLFGLYDHRKSETSRLSSFGVVLRMIPKALICGVSVVVAFAVPTYICYRWYGQRYLDEALLYHFHREDHRHNFSPYWLLMYLNQGAKAINHGTDYSAGLFAFIPQMTVLLYVAWKLRKNIAHACCVQTVIFIAFNKVCTVQYFVWFLAFLPFIFCQPKNAPANISRHASPVTAFFAVLLWATSIPVWVYSAGQVEGKGNNEFVMLWVASCFFFIATVVFAGWLGRQALRMQTSFSFKL